MGRRIRLEPHLTVDELARRYRAAKEPRERSRWQILWLLSQGQTASEVAMSTGYSRYWIGQPVRRYNTEGPEAMRNRQYTHSHCAQSLLSPEQLAYPGPIHTTQDLASFSIHTGNTVNGTARTVHGGVERIGTSTTAMYPCLSTRRRSERAFMLTWLTELKESVVSSWRRMAHTSLSTVVGDSVKFARNTIRKAGAQVLGVGVLLSVLGACGSVPGHPGPPTTSSETPGAVATDRVQYGAPEGYSLTHPFFAGRITFASGETFAGALRFVTDLGLQPVQYCDILDNGNSWHALRQQAGTNGKTVLEVAATPDAPPDWLARLNAAHNVTAIYDGWSGCTLMPVETPRPGNGVFTVGDYQTYTGTSVEARFNEITTYDQALSVVSSLGFRLADPCYEHALQAGKKPQWRTPGQSRNFSQTHALLIATTTVNSTLWQAQILAAPGVVAVVQPYQPTCAY